MLFHVTLLKYPSWTHISSLHTLLFEGCLAERTAMERDLGGSGEPDEANRINPDSQTPAHADSCMGCCFEESIVQSQ